MFKVQLASADMKDELRYVLKKAFEVDPDEIFNYFFNEHVIYENCVVSILDNKVVAALHLLDASIVCRNELFPIYYVYSAGTLPAFRNMGIMTKLLLYAKEIAKERGKRFVTLLPENKSLYGFYSQRGYQKLLKKKTCLMMKSEICRYATSAKLKPVHLELPQITKLRMEYFNADGNIVWDENHVKFAIHLNTIQGGELICSEGGYALCSKQLNNQLHVREFVSTEEDFPNLMARIRDHTNNEFITFNIPVKDKLFKKGVVSDYGMIMPVSDNPILSELTDPYLGLALN